jgi:hypothetical protein
VATASGSEEKVTGPANSAELKDIDSETWEGGFLDRTDAPFEVKPACRLKLHDEAVWMFLSPRFHDEDAAAAKEKVNQNIPLVLNLPPAPMVPSKLFSKIPDSVKLSV